MQIQNGSRSWTWELRPPRVLVAESDDLARAETCQALRADGYEVVEAHDGYELLDSVLAFPPGPTDCIDVIIATDRLPQCDGSEVLSRLRGMRIQTPFVVRGGRDGALSPEELGRAHADRMVTINGDLEQLKGAVFRLTHAF